MSGSRRCEEFAQRPFATFVWRLKPLLELIQNDEQAVGVGREVGPVQQASTKRIRLQISREPWKLSEDAFPQSFHGVTAYRFHINGSDGGPK